MMSATSRSTSSSISSWARRRISERSRGGVRRQAPKASCAASTAAVASTVVPLLTEAMTAPVAGSSTSNVEGADVHRPPTKMADAEVNILLPERGEGFQTFLREVGGAAQFGTQAMINALIDLARAWFLIHPEVPLQYGHISRKGGGPFWSSVNKGELAHKTHRDGRNVDIRPIRKDNHPGPTDINQSSYDPARTKELVLLMKQKHPGCTIYFNDPKLVNLRLTRKVKNHHHHLHFILP